MCFLSLKISPRLHPPPTPHPPLPTPSPPRAGSIPNWAVAAANTKQPLCLAAIRTYITKHRAALEKQMPECERVRAQMLAYAASMAAAPSSSSSSSGVQAIVAIKNSEICSTHNSYHKYSRSIFVVSQENVKLLSERLNFFLLFSLVWHYPQPTEAMLPLLLAPRQRASKAARPPLRRATGFATVGRFRTLPSWPRHSPPSRPRSKEEGQRAVAPEMALVLMPAARTGGSSTRGSKRSTFTPRRWASTI